jgi:predicted ATPase
MGKAGCARDLPGLRSGRWHTYSPHADCRESTMSQSQLRMLRLKGFRSIKEMELELRSLNVLIGANGAGKSNLISFFTLMTEMMAGRLQQYIGSTGRATANLHFGPKVTSQLEASLRFEVFDVGSDTYHIQLSHAAGDSLIFAEETLAFVPQESTLGRFPEESVSRTVSLGAGHQETRLGEKADQDERIAKRLRYLLQRCRVYHFHDTSATARVRQYCYLGDSRRLMPDAANLAAVLYRLRLENDVYWRIVATIQQIAPFFDDFILEPTGPGDREITLNWRHHDSDLIFGPHQLSDGTLRAICLVTLLLQPERDLPYLVIVDEPELGLHPYALNVIASLFKEAAHHAQFLISTQSSTLLDSFEPEDIIVVERKEEETVFTRQTEETLSTWLEDYSLGEIWEKNVIGGGPH